MLHATKAHIYIPVDIFVGIMRTLPCCLKFLCTGGRRLKLIQILNCATYTVNDMKHERRLQDVGELQTILALFTLATLVHSRNL